MNRLSRALPRALPRAWPRARTDAQAAIAATFAAALIIAQQIGAKSARDALFLSSFGAERLPAMMIAAAVLSIAGALLAARWLSRRGPARVVPRMFLAGAGLFALEWIASARAPAITAVAVYVHLSLLGSLAISAFWSLANERFDPHTAKSVFGRINAGAALGGVLGGLTADRVAHWLDTPSMLAVLAVANAACAIAVQAIGVPGRARTPEVAPGPAPSALGAFRSTPYLRRLGALVTMTALASVFVDFGLRSAASSSIGKGPALLSFFALFYTGVGLCTFVLQLGVTRRALNRLGLGATAGLHPLAVAILGLVAAAAPGLPAMLLLAAVEETLSNSVFRSAYELLYTPVSPAKKRAVKTLIDVAFDRAGDIAGAGTVMLIVALAPDTPRLVPALAACAGLFALHLTYRLQRGYIETLAENLASGAIALDAKLVVDRTTLKVLHQTMTLDRRQLLQQIEALRESDRARSGLSDDEADRLAAGAGALLSRDPRRAGEVLDAELDRRLIGFALPWLLHPELGARAESALARAVSSTAGQLLDAMIDRTVPLALRARIPAILARGSGPRVTGALLEGLEDESLEVAEACAKSLHTRSLDAPLPAERILAIAERAANREAWALDAQRRLEHVFELLGLVLDPHLVELARRALHTDDRALRGTALEYLDNVLPPPLARALSPHYGQKSQG